MSRYLCGSQFQVQLADTWINTVSVTQDGDDAIELFHWSSGEWQLTDTFGDVNIDGTGQPWEYTDSWAYRTALSPGAFNVADWTMGCVCCVSSCPYPLCTVDSPHPPPPQPPPPMPSGCLAASASCTAF
eukprot:4174637-Prymnesium_polylepis.1